MAISLPKFMTHKQKENPANVFSIAATTKRNDKIMQNNLLVWLDARIDHNDANYENTLRQLQKFINTIRTFTTNKKCVNFLMDCQYKNVFMIVSGSLGRQIMPFMHDISKVHSIYIFCSNRLEHQKWAKDWHKVKGVYTDIESIYTELKQSRMNYEQNIIGFTLIKHETNETINLNRLDPIFMYTYIIKRILLDIKFEREHFQGFIEYCKETFEEYTRDMEEVERNYNQQTPIWWYTKESFLYSMLNEALRLVQIDAIIKLGFFIQDLHRQLDELHQQQYTRRHINQQFTVYRGQAISDDEFQQISDTKDGLISFNHFLSTSRSERIAMEFVERSFDKIHDGIGILFIINIDPKQSTVPFASLDDVSAQGDEEKEIMFAMNTVFRIRNIRKTNNERMFRVELELTKDYDENLKQLMKFIDPNTCPNQSTWCKLGDILLKLGKFEQAEEIYRVLLEQEQNKRNQGYLLNQYGLCRCYQAEYELTIDLCKQAIKIYKKYAPKSPDLAKSYRVVGNAYFNLGKYKKALLYYIKDCKKLQKLFSSDYYELAESYSNIGNVYCALGGHEKALSYHAKAVEINRRTLPINHPDTAKTFLALGSNHNQMGNYSKSMEFYERALAIQKQSLPTDHHDFGNTYNSIGLVYENMRDYARAVEFFEKAMNIGTKSLSENHPARRAWENNFRRITVI